MANHERGEMALVCGADTYVLRLTTNACCHLEERSGQTYEEHLALWGKQRRITAFRWIVWASLQDQHGDVAKTLDAVGALIDRCDQKSLMTVMANFIALNSDEVQKLIAARLLTDLKEPDADPPPAQAIDGVDSTLTLVGSG